MTTTGTGTLVTASELQRCGSRSPAAQLLEAVRRGDAVTIQRVLRRPDLPRIAVELAEYAIGPKPLRPHGTHAAFNRHKAAGEKPCEDCWTAERAYQRVRGRRRYDIRVQPTPIDAVVIDRLVADEPLPRMSRAEKRTAFGELIARGDTPHQAGQRLRISGATARTWADDAPQEATG